MSRYGWSNCPAGARRQIERLVRGARLQLGENLVGIYLHGSLAMNCFNPLRSDIDLLAVTERRMTKNDKRRLARLLLETSAKPSPLEISFLCRADLSPWRHPAPFDLHYGEDWREKFEHNLTDEKSGEWNDARRFDEDLAAHITVTGERGACLYGKPAAEVFPAVPRRDFLDSVLADVQSEKCGLDAVLQNPVYVVLNACRTLACLRTGRILSKDEGAVRAMKDFPPPYRKTVAKALEAYRSLAGDGELNEKELVDFADFARRELEKSAR